MARSYPPSMQPLAFPTGAAQVAAAQCRAMARLVAEKMGASSRLAHRAAAHWRGVHANDFGITWPDTELSAEELRERLLRLAGEIDTAIDAAATEDRRRAIMREEYDYERLHPRGPI